MSRMFADIGCVIDALLDIQNILLKTNPGDEGRSVVGQQGCGEAAFEAFLNQKSEFRG